MSDQWLLDQLLALYGVQYTIALFDPILVARLRNGHNILSLTHDLLPLVLSYVSLSDVRNIMCTCKAFYAATQKRDFWRVNVERYKIRRAETIANVTVTTKRLIRLFDTFLVPDETLRQQVGFIFIRPTKFALLGSLKTKGQFNKHLSPIGRFIDDSQNQLVFYEYDSVTLELVYVYTFLYSKRVHGPFGLVKRWTMSSNHDLISYAEFHCDGFDSINSAKSCLIHRRFDNGDTYKGEGIYDSTAKQLVCHGTGRWEFASDSSILEGPGVAYMNEPRFTREYKRIKV